VKFKSFIIGVILGATLFSGLAYGAVKMEMISVSKNTINLKVDGKKTNSDNFLYEGRTYVQLREVAEMVGKEVGWNGDTRTASIQDKTKLVITQQVYSEDSPEHTVTEVLNALKIMDKKTVENHFTQEELFAIEKKENNFNNKEIEKLFFKNLDYKIKSSSADGDTAIVKTEITNLDMKSIMGEYISSAMGLAMLNAFTTDGSAISEEELNIKTEEMLINMLSRADNKKVTTTVDIKLSKNENEWRIDIQEDLQDALTGGTIAFREELEKSGLLHNDGNNVDEINNPKSKLAEINDYIISDIWNEGFCDIGWYVSMGTNSIGGTMDIDFTISQLEIAYGKKKEYDEFISNLDENEFANVKNIWKKLSIEMDVLFNKLKCETPIANSSDYNFDTGKFDQYMNAFSDAIYKIKMVNE
jgi:hypothetical protein